MKTIIHKAETRGKSKNEWLNSNHTFSFSNYYDPERIHFGALRVLNDDIVAPKEGFGKHPHQNMEIVSIPLEGMLVHGDSHGNKGTLSKGEIQIMSAGTGVFHSEMNGSDTEPVKFLQIWVIPNKMNVEPRYIQKAIDFEKTNNNFSPIVFPEGKDKDMWIHQDAWFSLSNFKKDFKKTYQFHSKDNGLYVFVIDGKIKVDKYEISKRDGIGIYETDNISFEAMEDSEFLLMEVPMQ